MLAGETVRISCPNCDVEYAVVYEPKAAGKPEEAEGIPPASPEFCPFCGKFSAEDVT